MAQLPDGTEIPDTLVPQLHKAGLMDELYKNPATKRQLLELVKTHKPDLPIPEIDQPKAFETETVQPLLKKMDDFRADLEKQRAEQAREREQTRALRAGLTEADLPEVDKLMTEKKIADWDTAVEHLRMSQRLAVPRSMPSPLTLPSMEGLMANPQKWARDEAYKVVNELRSQR